MREYKFATSESIVLQDENTPEWQKLQDDFIVSVCETAKRKGVTGTEFWNIGMMLGFDANYPEKFNGPEA